MFSIRLIILITNLTTKTAGLLKATAGAAASAKTFGFNADLKLDIDALIKESESIMTSSKGSNISAGGSLNVKAGNTAKIEGSNVNANSDIIIDAESVDILAAENTTESSSSEKNVHITATLDTSSGLGLNASGSKTEDGSDSTTYTNSHLNATNITIISTKDTTVKGAVVKAENELNLDVGGDLTVKSLQDKDSSKSVTLGASGGYGNNDGKESGNGGVNFNISKSESKWVNEQTSLTGGGKVTIDVEDKTTLKGAVIASTHSTGSGQAGDLTLETGTLEYSNIKDKDKSYNVGGGGNYGVSETANGNKTNYSANANYEFSDKKQTNFATIGEGTIIIKDEETDLTDLKRDITLAQYNTKEGGLKGGFTVDNALVDLITSPYKTVTDTLDSLKQGYNDGKETANKIITAAGETVDNLFKTDEEGKSDKQETDKKEDEAKVEEKKEQKTKDIESLEGNEKEVAKLQLILEKMANGEPLTNEEKAAALTSFFSSINQKQKGGSTLQTELENAINSDPESFREVMDKAGFNVDNEGDVQEFAKKTQASQCVQLTMFIQGVMNGYTDPASMGEYFKTAVENGLVDEKGYQKKSTQEVFDTIYGKDKVQVIGCGTDPGGGTFKDADGNPTNQTDKSTGSDILANLKQTINDSGAKDITVRVKSTLSPYDHNMSIINNGDGTYTLNDTSCRGTNITISSNEFKKYVNKDTIKSFYYTKIK